MNLVLKVEIPNLEFLHFCWNLRSLQHLGYGCFAASRTWNEAGNLRTCALAETPGVHHTKQCHPSSKTESWKQETNLPVFLLLSDFFEASKLHNWTMLTSKHPVPQVSAFNRFGSFWNHTSHLHNSAQRCNHLHSTDVLGKSFQCTVPKHVVDMVVRYRQ